MASSKLAGAISDLSGKHVSDDEIYSLTTSKMEDPKDLPKYEAGQDFTHYGQELMTNPDLFNGYLNTLVRQFGVIFQKVSLAQNPLSMFKKGLMPFGGNLESIVYDTMEQKRFDPFFRDSKGEKQSPYEQNLNNPVSGVYSTTQDVTTPVTIIDTVDTQYFQNLAQFHTYVWGKIASLINGAVLDEYYHTKLTLSAPIADGHMPVVNIQEGTDATKKLAKAIKTMAKKMRYFSRDYNGEGVNQATLVQNLVVLVSVDRSVDLDMDYFGQLFNPENARDFNVQYVEIDQFPSIWRYTKDHVITQDDVDSGLIDVKTPSNPYGHYHVGDTVKQGTLARPGATDASLAFDGSKLAAVVMDRDALQVWDQLPTTLSAVSNPRGRYNNVFLNKKALFAYITGLNASGIYISDKADGKITFGSKSTQTVAVPPTKQQPSTGLGH